MSSRAVSLKHTASVRDAGRMIDAFEGDQLALEDRGDADHAATIPATTSSREIVMKSPITKLALTFSCEIHCVFLLRLDLTQP